MAAPLVFFVVLLAMTGASDAAWCVCRTDLSDAALQRTLDYACGAGANCNPILQNGPCFNPNTVKVHCSYAVNSYYQRKGQAQGTCDFAATAILSNSDPSTPGCSYPSSPSSAGTSTTPTTTSPGSTSTTNPGFNPSTGTGGVLGSLGPSGNTITDTSNAGFISGRGSLTASTILLGLALMLRG